MYRSCEDLYEVGRKLWVLLILCINSFVRCFGFRLDRALVGQGSTTDPPLGRSHRTAWVDHTGQDTSIINQISSDHRNLFLLCLAIFPMLGVKLNSNTMLRSTRETTYCTCVGSSLHRNCFDIYSSSGTESCMPKMKTRFKIWLQTV